MVDEIKISSKITVQRKVVMKMFNVTNILEFETV